MLIERTHLYTYVSSWSNVADERRSAYRSSVIRPPAVRKPTMPICLMHRAGNSRRVDGIDEQNWDIFQTQFKSDYRGHDFKLYKQFSSSTVLCSSFFAQGVINVWNSLLTSFDFSSLPSQVASAWKFKWIFNCLQIIWCVRLCVIDFVRSSVCLVYFSLYCFL